MKFIKYYPCFLQHIVLTIDKHTSTLWIDDEYLKTLVHKGCHFLTEDESLVGMLALYLHKSNIPITVGKIAKEIKSITKTVIEEGGLPKSDLIFPSSQTGLLKLSMQDVVLTRTMKMVSKTNYTSCIEYNDPNDGWLYTLESERIYFNGGHVFFSLQKTVQSGIIKHNN